MTEQWGPPLQGEQMKLLRAAGMAGNTVIRAWQDDHAVALPLSRCSYCSWIPYSLPTDHIAYTLLEEGWLDGRNVRLWFGGETAPDDWDGGDVLLRNGVEWDTRESKVNYWRIDGGYDDIIAYITKDEVVEAPVDDHQMDLTSNNDQETVTIAKMTEAEAKRLYPHLDLNTLKDLRLIKPEPTREERFWALHEPEGTTVPTHIKKWVKDALEFER